MDKLIVSSIISAGIMCLMQILLGSGSADAEDARDGPSDAEEPEYDVDDADGEAPPVCGECGKLGRVCGQLQVICKRLPTGDLALLRPECPPHPVTHPRPGHFKRRSRRTQWHEKDREETNNKRYDAGTDFFAKIMTYY